MGIGIAIGITLIIGTLMTPILQGRFDVLLGTPVVNDPFRGVRRPDRCCHRQLCRVTERTGNGHSGGRVQPEKGLILAVMCGIFSAGMSFAMDAAKPMHEAASALGINSLYVALPSYVIIMGGGAIINLSYCFIRLATLKTCQSKPTSRLPSHC